MGARDEIWIIWDLLDGPHLFESEVKALNKLEKWKEEAEDRNDFHDSVWDMIGPIKYVKGSK